MNHEPFPISLSVIIVCIIIAFYKTPTSSWFFTAVQCENGLEYSPCGSTCVESCESINNPPENCDGCSEGCFCPEGTVPQGKKKFLDGSHCFWLDWCYVIFKDKERVLNFKVCERLFSIPMQCDYILYKADILRVSWSIGPIMSIIVLQ